MLSKSHPMTLWRLAKEFVCRTQLIHRANASVGTHSVKLASDTCIGIVGRQIDTILEGMPHQQFAPEDSLDCWMFARCGSVSEL
jgi:hypothetical protein